MMKTPEDGATEVLKEQEFTWVKIADAVEDIFANA